ncbi:MAG: ScpA family protein [Patescibacteria group bacterium]
MFEFRIDKFSGPLDLLLQLIEQAKLDISEISLGKATEQYLGYVNQSPQIAPEELADFLVIATKLILIKSRLLLPTLDIEEEGSSLADQLKMYKEYVEATKVMEKIIRKKHFVYLRERMLVSAPAFRPPKGLTVLRLAEVFARVLHAIAPLAELPKKMMLKAISIGEKMEQIKKIIFERARSGFRHFLKEAKNKTEVIISFLALLELIKQKAVTVSQKNLFEDIEIKQA